jgi:hypothetical protein
MDVLYVQAKATFHVVFFITRSVVDPEPAWILFGLIRIRILILGKMTHKKRKSE